MSEKIITKDIGDLVCEECEDESEQAEETFCPYQRSVNNRMEEVILCSKCLHQREMEV